MNDHSGLTLISHHLCPYVQRAAISLAEKGISFKRIDIDLANKPAWFTTLSPLGKVPLLRVTASGKTHAIFESAVILEFLEETLPRPLHPKDPLERAHHRSWIEFGSSILNGIAKFYNAPTQADLDQQARRLADMFARVEGELDAGPWFAGQSFSLVDAVYGPVFRYFDIFDHIDDFAIFHELPKTAAWRRTLGSRDSIIAAVPPDYPARLMAFIKNRKGALAARAGTMELAS